MRDLSPLQRLCRFAFWKHAWPFSFFAPPSLCFPETCVTFLFFRASVALLSWNMRDLSLFCLLCRLLFRKHAWPFSLLSPMSLAYPKACSRTLQGKNSSKKPFNKGFKSSRLKALKHFNYNLPNQWDYIKAYISSGWGDYQVRIRKDFPQNQRISPSPSHLRPEKRRHIWCGFPWI